MILGTLKTAQDGPCPIEHKSVRETSPPPPTHTPHTLPPPCALGGKQKEICFVCFKTQENGLGIAASAFFGFTVSRLSECLTNSSENLCLGGKGKIWRCGASRRLAVV